MWNNYATPRGLFETRSALQIPSHLLVFKFDIFTWGNIISQCSDSQGSFTCSLTLIDKITTSGSVFKNIIWFQTCLKKISCTIGHFSAVWEAIEHVINSVWCTGTQPWTGTFIQHWIFSILPTVIFQLECKSLFLKEQFLLQWLEHEKQ